jgi:protein TonB
VLVSQSRIEYPPVARAQRITGSIVISALVDELGNVAEARVIRGAAPNSGLNQAALDNVKRRKYKPATMGGKPGRAWIAVQIEFKL